eukprot:2016383-Prymnesium_polylepis.1
MEHGGDLPRVQVAVPRVSGSTRDRASRWRVDDGCARRRLRNAELCCCVLLQGAGREVCVAAPPYVVCSCISESVGNRYRWCVGWIACCGRDRFGEDAGSERGAALESWIVGWGEAEDAGAGREEGVERHLCARDEDEPRALSVGRHVPCMNNICMWRGDRDSCVFGRS